MEFKGTQGKWYINRWGNVASDTAEVAYMPSLTTKEQKEANALLISKAPEMLEMLGDIRQALLMENSPESLVLADAIEQLIKEATEL